MEEPTRIVIGCNYHTTWQRDKGMRFVLVAINGTKATLETRRSNKRFETNINDLIFIKTLHNTLKADRIEHLNGKMIHSKIDNIHCADIDFKDAPDFVDAYIESADYDGRKMTEDQLNEINEDSEYVYDAVLKQIY